MVNQVVSSIYSSPHLQQFPFSQSDLDDITSTSNQRNKVEFPRSEIPGVKSRKRGLFSDQFHQVDDRDNLSVNGCLQKLLEIADKVAENGKEDTLTLDFVNNYLTILQKDIRIYRQHCRKKKLTKSLPINYLFSAQDRTSVFKNISQLIDSVVAFKGGKSFPDQRTNKSNGVCTANFNKRGVNQFEHDHQSTNIEQEILFLIKIGKQGCIMRFQIEEGATDESCSGEERDQMSRFIYTFYDPIQSSWHRCANAEDMVNLACDTFSHFNFNHRKSNDCSSARDNDPSSDPSDHSISGLDKEEDSWRWIVCQVLLPSTCTLPFSNYMRNITLQLRKKEKALAILHKRQEIFAKKSQKTFSQEDSSVISHVISPTKDKSLSNISQFLSCNDSCDTSILSNENVTSTLCPSKPTSAMETNVENSAKVKELEKSSQSSNPPQYSTEVFENHSEDFNKTKPAQKSVYNTIKTSPVRDIIPEEGGAEGSVDSKATYVENCFNDNLLLSTYYKDLKAQILFDIDHGGKDMQLKEKKDVDDSSKEETNSRKEISSTAKNLCTALYQNVKREVLLSNDLENNTAGCESHMIGMEPVAPWIQNREKDAEEIIIGNNSWVNEKKLLPLRQEEEKLTSSISTESENPHRECYSKESGIYENYRTSSVTSEEKVEDQTDTEHPSNSLKNLLPSSSEDSRPLRNLKVFNHDSENSQTVSNIRKRSDQRFRSKSDQVNEVLSSINEVKELIAGGLAQIKHSSTSQKEKSVPNHPHFLPPDESIRQLEEDVDSSSSSSADEFPNYSFDIESDREDSALQMSADIYINKENTNKGDTDVLKEKEAGNLGSIEYDTNGGINAINLTVENIHENDTEKYITSETSYTTSPHFQENVEETNKAIETLPKNDSEITKAKEITIKSPSDPSPNRTDPSDRQHRLHSVFPSDVSEDNSFQLEEPNPMGNYTNDEDKEKILTDMENLEKEFEFYIDFNDSVQYAEQNKPTAYQSVITASYSAQTKAHGDDLYIAEKRVDSDMISKVQHEMEDIRKQMQQNVERVRQEGMKENQERRLNAFNLLFLSSGVNEPEKTDRNHKDEIEMKNERQSAISLYSKNPEVREMEIESKIKKNPSSKTTPIGPPELDSAKNIQRLMRKFVDDDESQYFENSHFKEDIKKLGGEFTLKKPENDFKSLSPKDSDLEENDLQSNYSSTEEDNQGKEDYLRKLRQIQETEFSLPPITPMSNDVVSEEYPKAESTEGGIGKLNLIDHSPVSKSPTKSLVSASLQMDEETFSQGCIDIRNSPTKELKIGNSQEAIQSTEASPSILDIKKTVGDITGNKSQQKKYTSDLTFASETEDRQKLQKRNLRARKIEKMKEKAKEQELASNNQKSVHAEEEKKATVDMQLPQLDCNFSKESSCNRLTKSSSSFESNPFQEVGHIISGRVPIIDPSKQVEDVMQRANIIQAAMKNDDEGVVKDDRNVNCKIEKKAKYPPATQFNIPFHDHKMSGPRPEVSLQPLQANIHPRLSMNLNNNSRSYAAQRQKQLQYHHRQQQLLQRHQQISHPINPDEGTSEETHPSYFKQDMGHQERQDASASAYHPRMTQGQHSNTPQNKANQYLPAHSPFEIRKKMSYTTPRKKLQPLNLQHPDKNLNLSTVDGNLPSGRGHDYASATVVSNASSSSSVLPLSARGITNFKLIRNAICHVCLAGPINNTNKEKALGALERFPQSNFVILFHSSSTLTFRGLYRLEEIYPNNNQNCNNGNSSAESTSSSIAKIQGRKIFGSGPSYIKEEWIECFYKYNSAGRKFQKLPATRSLTVMTDGITVDPQTMKRIKSNASTHHHVGYSN